MKKLFILMTILFVSACGNLGDKFNHSISPKADEAVVYFYRPSKLFGGGVFYDIKDNDSTITTLYNGGYYPYITKAGNKTFTARTEVSEVIQLNVENGKTYYVRGKVHMGAFIGRPVMKLVHEEKALREIKECKIIEE